MKCEGCNCLIGQGCRCQYCGLFYCLNCLEIYKQYYTCKKCKGEGYSVDRGVLYRCPKCFGRGELDWLENIVGPKYTFFQVTESSPVKKFLNPIYSILRLNTTGFFSQAKRKKINTIILR